MAWFLSSGSGHKVKKSQVFWSQVAENRSTGEKVRQPISLEKKLKIVELLEKGTSVSKLSKFYDFPVSTILTIRREKESIKRARSSPDYAHSKARIKDVDLMNMERLLLLWIDDQAERQVSLSSGMVRKKAVEIYNYLSQCRPNNHAEFLGGSDWYEKLRTRYDLSSKVVGHAAFDVYHQVANVRLANLFIFDFNHFIEMEKYRPDQIFCMKETKLCWKKIPGKDFEPAKDRVTVLLCSNMACNVRLKPFVVLKMDLHTPLHPNNCQCCVVPVHWYTAGFTWMDSTAFKKWLQGSFVPDVKSYCQSRGVPFKILLLMDKAPSHRDFPKIPNITIMYSPPNADSIINPMNQGIISAFQIGYLQKTLQALLEVVDTGFHASLSEVWKNFGKNDAINLISQAWDWISEATMKEAWSHISENKEDSQARDLKMANEIEQCLLLFKKLVGDSYSHVRKADVEEVLESHNQELSNEELSDLCDIFPSEMNISDGFEKALIDSEDDIRKRKRNCKGKVSKYEESNEFQDPTFEVEASSGDIFELDEESQNEFEATSSKGVELSSLVKLEIKADEEEEERELEVGYDPHFHIKYECADESSPLHYNTDSRSDEIEIIDEELRNESESVANRIKVTRWNGIKLEEVKKEKSEGELGTFLNRSINEERLRKIKKQKYVYPSKVINKQNIMDCNKQPTENMTRNTSDMPTATNLQRLMNLMKKLIEKSQKNDPNHTRRNQFIADVEDAMQPYKSLLDQKH